MSPASAAVRLTDFEPEVDDFAEDVRRGLAATPKQLHPKYFYDAAGSKLFDRICATSEYYPTRTETAMLREYADEIAESTLAEVRHRGIFEIERNRAVRISSDGPESAAEAARLPVPEIVFLKDAEEWTLIGKPMKRLDVPDKLAGRPVFGADVEVAALRTRIVIDVDAQGIGWITNINRI